MAYYLHNYLYKFSKYGKSNYPWKMNIIFSPYQIFITNFQIRQSYGETISLGLTHVLMYTYYPRAITYKL